MNTLFKFKKKVSYQIYQDSVYQPEFDYSNSYKTLVLEKSYLDYFMEIDSTHVFSTLEKKPLRLFHGNSLYARFFSFKKN